LAGKGKIRKGTKSEPGPSFHQDNPLNDTSEGSPDELWNRLFNKNLYN